MTYTLCMCIWAAIWIVASCWEPIRDLWQERHISANQAYAKAQYAREMASRTDDINPNVDTSIIPDDFVDYSGQRCCRLLCRKKSKMAIIYPG